MPKVEFKKLASEDIRAIADSAVICELIHLARTELRVPPTQRTAIEGWVWDRHTKQDIFWRRAVPLHQVDKYLREDLDPDVDEFENQMFDHVYVYARILPDKAIKKKLPLETLVIDRVLSKPEMVRRFLETYYGE